MFQFEEVSDAELVEIISDSFGESCVEKVDFPVVSAKKSITEVFKFIALA